MIFCKYSLASLFLFFNSHCMQFARQCNCPQSIELLEIIPQNIKVLAKSFLSSPESLHSQNKSRPPGGERHILLQGFTPALLLVFFRCTRPQPYRPPHPSSGTGSCRPCRFRPACSRCSPCGGCLLEQLRGQNRAFGLHLRVEQVAELVGDILAVTNDSSRLVD